MSRAQPAPPLLDERQTLRYQRHLAIPEIGERGQQRLLASRVLVVGVGGLGSPVALYLAAAGVGTLGLVDPDAVDLSNLQRQVLHTTARVGTPKVESARTALEELNPDLELRALREPFAEGNARALVQGFDLVVGCVDNFAARYLLNDTCHSLGTPLVDGAVAGFEGRVTVYVPGRGPCYRCLFPEPPPPELSAGVSKGILGVLPGVVGTLQANEALKLLLGIGDPLVGRMVTFDALRGETRTILTRADPACPTCARGDPTK